MLPSKLSFLAPLFALPYGTQKGRMTFYSRPPFYFIKYLLSS